MKILIRKAKKGDGKGLAENFNEGLRRGSNLYTGGNRPVDKKKINKREKEYSKYNKHRCVYVAIDEDTGKLIGCCDFGGSKSGRTRHRAECGWSVHPDYAKKGIATKIMRKLIQEAKKRGFKRLEAEAAIINKASVKLAKKVGFKVEGIKKAGLLLDNGKYADTYILGMVLK
jgi:RimJ/RimL family protein N-acetyltransferase